MYPLRASEGTPSCRHRCGELSEWDIGDEIVEKNLF